MVRIETEDLPPGRLPPGPADRSLYAIGDVHGRDDLLEPLLDAIAAHADRTAAGGRPSLLVGLGDYVDRGPGSAAVIERLTQVKGIGVWTVHMFLMFALRRPDVLPTGDLGIRAAIKKAYGLPELPKPAEMEQIAAAWRPYADADEAGPWLANGGGATLASYGVAVGAGWPERARYGALRDALARNLPPHHRRFLDTLATSHAAGDYLFVHAGIRPGVPMDDQDFQDLIWIRGPFLRATGPLGALVVHGHTIAPEPELKTNRIGIDTGAFASGRLTALAITGARVRLFTAIGTADRSYLGL